MESFPFDSKSDGYDTDGYPVYDRAVGSSMLRTTFERFFSNGVFPTPGNALQIAKGATGLTVTIQPGIAIINGAMGGIEGTDPVTLTLDTASPQGNVCYAIMLRFDATEEMRSLYFNVVRSDAAATPTPPEPDMTTPLVYELRLGYVTVPSNATDLSGATVTNEKGLEYCPFAAPFEEIDVSAITTDFRVSANEALTALLDYFNQYEDMVAAAVDGTLAGQLQNQITELKEQLANFDLSGSVDNETIAYSQKPGGSKETLHVPSGGIGTEEKKNSSISIEKLSKDVVDKINTKPLGLNVSAYTWEELSAIVNNDSITTEELQYLVGQTKSVTISGYGMFDFQVIGVRNDDLSDGSGKAGLTFQSVPCITTQNMNSTNDTTGGWASTSMRSWLNSTIYNAISSDLKPYVKKVKKKYCATTTYSNVSTCDDYLFLTSHIEVLGDSNYGAEGTWYQYWSLHDSNDERIKYLNSTKKDWWFRSVNSSSEFRYVYTDGRGLGTNASSMRGVAPCFCI